MLAEASGLPLTAHPSTPAEMLLETATRYPDNRAFVSMYQNSARYEPPPNTAKDGFLTWTYRQLDKKADDLAASLADQGLRAGMRLVVFLPNSAEWALLFWASIKLGTAFVPLDERAVSRRDHVDHFLSILKPSALFVSNAAHARILLENHPLQLNSIAIKAITEPAPSRVDGWQILEHFLVRDASSHGLDPTNGHPVPDEPAKTSSVMGHGEVRNGQKESDLDSILYILFTSGTSGLPKACSISNRNVWASAMATNSFDRMDHTGVMLINAPPSHSLGISSILTPWFKGATAVIPSPVFDAKMTIETIDRLNCTHTSGMPCSTGLWPELTRRSHTYDDPGSTQTADI